MREQTVEDFWKVARVVGVENVLQALVDEMGETKIQRLTARLAATISTDAWGDAYRCMIRLGERPDRINVWLEQVRTQEPQLNNTGVIMQRMLVLRAKGPTMG